MAIEKLSARAVASAKEGKHEDGGGLRLVVSAKGSKRWVFRYTFNRKRREMGLGPYPTVTLAKAREEAMSARRMVFEGLDPITERKRTQVVIPTFEDCSIQFIEAHQAGWKNAKHASQWRNTLSTYAHPVLGTLPVNVITVNDVRKVLDPIWTTKNETAKRLQTRIAKILDYAAALGHCDSDNPARWQGKLDALLPKPSSIQKVKHHPAMPYSEIGQFWKELDSQKRTSAAALRFLVLTATRTSEVLEARWNEIDLDQAIWTIPAERMKMNKEHRVPLCKQAIELLKAIPKISESAYLFPGSRAGKPLSNMTLLKLMRDMGFGKGSQKGDYVPHGFRSTFRDWAGEVSSYPRDIAEMALAHAIENKVEAAYRRGDLLEKRTRMMQDWADYIAS